MEIEIYVNIILYLYIGLFLLSIFTGIIALWKRIRKKSLKYAWVIPYLILYSLFALFNTFIAYNSYDDCSNPNYSRYENWKLPNFILNDVKMLIIGLFFGGIFYFVFVRKKCNILIKKGAVAVLFVIMFFLFFFKMRII
ncbi:hypothetical protein IMSAGC011_02370 [Lachnospiraceae bacterium]|nr:hypothetical protein IMSAGC011_02370 [Lachnospiraceae bacterium]